MQHKDDKGNYVDFYVENTQKQLVMESNNLFVLDSTLQSCISPTDCFILRTSSSTNSKDSNDLVSFGVIVDNQTVYQNVTTSSATSMELKFGYSQEDGMKANTCEDYIICNRSIASGSLQRQVINLITKISGVDVFGDGGKDTHLTAICWWLDDVDEKMKYYNGRDDRVLSTALIQRYLLALLYVSAKCPNRIITNYVYTA